MAPGTTVAVQGAFRREERRGEGPMHKNLLGMIAAMAVLPVWVEATHADFIFDPQGDAIPVLGKPGPLLDIDTVALADGHRVR